MNSIVIANSHTLFREALCDYIRHADKTLAIEGVSDMPSLIARINESETDLVLVEEDLPGFDSNMMTDERVGLIVLHMDEKLLTSSTCQGVFPRNLSSKDFLLGIQEILSGKTFFPPVSQILSMDAQSSLHQKHFYDFNLTVREKEVLTYLVKGQSNKDIARALNLQVVTVKLHVRGICRKMKAGNRTQAALIAQEGGWG